MIYRVTHRPPTRAYHRCFLIEDVEGDRVSRSASQITIWKVQLVIGKPRWVVALRGRAVDLAHVEERCRK